MGKKNDSTIVAGAGFIADLIMKLRADVIDLGGSDEHLFALNKGDGRPTIRKMAKLVVGATKPVVGATKYMSLAEMIAAAGFPSDRVHAGINERLFPLAYEGIFSPTGLRLFGGDREWTLAEAEAAAQSDGRWFAGLVRGLAYLKANPGALKDGPIAFPAYTCSGNPRVPYARLVDGGGPWLDLKQVLYVATRWDRRCRFLVGK